LTLEEACPGQAIQKGVEHPTEREEIDDNESRNWPAVSSASNMLFMETHEPHNGERKHQNTVEDRVSGLKHQ
jgi:hypothetical protein